MHGYFWSEAWFSTDSTFARYIFPNRHLQDFVESSFANVRGGYSRDDQTTFQRDNKASYDDDEDDDDDDDGRRQPCFIVCTGSASAVWVGVEC